MSRTSRRCARAVAIALAACALLVALAPAASADPKIPFSQDVYARTHLAKSGIDITVPPGQFNGTIDLATGEETGTLTLPPATVTMNLFGVLPAADATFVMAPAGPITGHVDLTTFAVDTTASFFVQLAKLTPHGTDVNLVGDHCTTTEPITVRMQGVVNPATGGTFASTYTIPDFEDCGLLTQVITAFVSGPGNTFLATFAAAGSPPPPAPTAATSSAPASTASVGVGASVTVGATPAGDTTASVDQQLALPPVPSPPLITATPASAPTTTTAPPVTIPPTAGGLGDLVRGLLGGG
jgi:hypothetical protein